MAGEEDKVSITVEYPEPPKLDKEELEAKLRSAMVLFFPELTSRGEVVFVLQPRA